MKNSILLVVCVVLLASSVSADTFGTGVNEFTIDFVNIGNAANPGDTRAEAYPSGCGAVDYEYQIGKYEITNGQWDAFVSAAGAPVGNPSSAYDENAYWTGTDVPTGYVSWYEAAQFCNYLTSGDKSQGAYQLGTNGSINIDRSTAEMVYGIVYVLPTEDEWYKAAYYKPDGSGYSTYANGTDVAPIAGDDTNYDDVIGQPWDIGTGTMEQNGTFDMMGNVWEWNETLIDHLRGFRGGSYAGNAYPNYDSYIRSYYRDGFVPDWECGDFGFRVASVSEPTNHLPVADAGLDQIGYACIDEIAEVTLDGSDSNDIDGDELSYYWSWTIDDEIYDANGVGPTIELPVGEHVIELIVNDGTEDSEPNEVVITVIGPIEADLYIVPRVINRNSRGRSVMAIITLPEGIGKDDIDVDVVFTLFPGEIAAKRQFVREDEEVVKVFALFSRSDLMNAVAANGEVELTIVGRLKSGQCVYGADSVRIIKPRRRLQWQRRQYR